ncbi:hypothetical protein [Alteribacter natronophilus]|uniref:hypothetical protein n=1 Tax=Alteribacter natronophilus TaxID=2583810 RepID=UPI00110F44DA|nr:hypothetical protein [Alteribacter natronophilus]TMW73047.1 hypothetical protein FGB90_01690 [Alteribacter natronophilus]
MYYNYGQFPYRPDHSYPPVDIGAFHESLSANILLLQHGYLIVSRLSSSPSLMHRLMSAAQEGNDEEVDRIVDSTGVPTIVETTYTPTSVTFRLQTDAQTFPRCCTLTMNLVWGLRQTGFYGIMG